MKKTFLFALLLLSGFASAQISHAKIEKLSASGLNESLLEFREFLSLQNIGRNVQDVEENLEWCKEKYEELGFEVQRLETSQMPLLLADKKVQGAKHTVLFYTQIDGQPVDPSEWDQESPYIATLKKQEGTNQWTTIPWVKEGFDPDWRIYARSTSDSKGPAMMLMSALDIINTNKIRPAFNIKVIMDFQEELGSPVLVEAIENYHDLLKADYLVIMDGTRSVLNEPTLTYGARGIATITLKFFGAKEDAHSGQFGNYVPNPVFSAARLIASMKDESGKVLIPHFYDGVNLSAEEKGLINAIQDDEDALLSELGISNPEAVGETFQESLQYPSLNIRGMMASGVGEEVRTIIPSEVVVEIDMRLVPETPGERQVELVKDFIEQQGFHIVKGQPTEEERGTYEKLVSFDFRLGSLPFRTELNSDMGVWLTKAVERATKKEPLQMRTTGGSQPISPFISTLKIPAIAIRVPNPGSNIHAANENIRIGNFLEGIATCISVLTEPIIK